MKNYIKDSYEKLKIFLNKIRNVNPEFFDWTSKFGVYIFSFITSFTPVLTVPNWLIYTLIFISFSSILTFQWIALTNAKENNAKDLEEKYNQKIIEVKKFYEKNIFIFATLMADFSSYVSHKIKNIIAKMPATPNGETADLISNFFNESLNKIEDLLSQYYCEEIRASIKLNSSNESFKTYGRGKNNIRSRGGEAQIAIYNQEKIGINRNYAYNMIISSQTPYFAESDLTNIKNKIKEDDVFYCEYENYLNIFRSTLIISLRYPIFSKIPQVNRNFEILGILCIDCANTVPEWSNNDITSSLGYNIITDYVDKLCVLIKKYSDGMKKQNKKYKKK